MPIAQTEGTKDKGEQALDLRRPQRSIQAAREVHEALLSQGLIRRQPDLRDTVIIEREHAKEEQP